MKSVLKLALLTRFGSGDRLARGRAPQKDGAGPAEPVIKVLFLGDQGHHRPADRAAQITPVLAGRGIDVTYTEKLGDLNPQTLARYDALLIYANITEIGPDQEKALLDYVTRRRRIRPGPLRVVLLPAIRPHTSRSSAPSFSGTARASSTPRSSIRRIRS